MFVSMVRKVVALLLVHHPLLLILDYCPFTVIIKSTVIILEEKCKKYWSFGYKLQYFLIYCLLFLGLFSRAYFYKSSKMLRLHKMLHQKLPMRWCLSCPSYNFLSYLYQISLLLLLASNLIVY